MKDDEQALGSRLAIDLVDVEAEIELGYALLRQGLVDEGVGALRRAIEKEPGHIDARRHLAFALHHDERVDDAVAALRDWQQYDPDNPVARHMLAAFTGAAVPARAGDDYIRLMFDRVAAEFDDHIASLGYRAPDLVAQAMEAAVERAAELDVLDAGCGTGLCGPVLRPYARRLIGVDLSAGMLAQARLRGCYDLLEPAELTAFMMAHRSSFDAVVCADTLNYFGDLTPPLNAAAAALREGGFIMLTVEASQPGDRGIQLDPNGRYRHSETYLRQCAADAGLRVCCFGSADLRHEGGRAVAGFVLTARTT